MPLQMHMDMASGVIRSRIVTERGLLQSHGSSASNFMFANVGQHPRLHAHW